jgi:hypothetical protein
MSLTDELNYAEVSGELVKALRSELEHAPTSMVRQGIEVDRKFADCLIWRGAMSGESPVAYGANRERLSIRRFVFEVVNRPLRRSEHVTTSCRTHRCILPAHLVVSGLSTEDDEL